MLRICISGFTDTGKTSIGNAISNDLNIMHITKYGSAAYKDFKKTETQGNEVYNILQTANKEYADSFDNEVKTLAKNNNCVVTTWIGPWIVEEPTIRVWLYAPFDERARRCSVERKLSIEDAKDYVTKKDAINSKAFMDLYGIDVNKRENFDIEINTGKSKLEETVSLISMLAMGKEKLIFR